MRNIKLDLKNSIIVLLLIMVVTVCFAVLAMDEAHAAETKTGVVNYAYGLNVRSGAGTSYDAIGFLEYGKEVTITKEVEDSSGVKWYKISYNGTAGYVCAVYIDIKTSSSSSDTEYETKTGIVNYASGLNVRSGAGTLNQVLGTLLYGEEVTITGETKDSSGNKWYEISYNGGTGYVNASYIDIKSTNEYVYDEAFEAELTAQGFPESYKVYLRQLHGDYPNWVFKSCKTGLKWSSVIAKETEVGVNLVNGNTAPASWKSMEKGAYDFSTSTYTVFDSGGWVAASESIIKYYMDPRNFLNSGGIFQFLAHSYDAETQTEEGLNNVLSGTFMAKSFPESGYSTYSKVLMEAGKKSNVNPYVLASMILVEQGNTGTGGCISGTVSGYEGYYNFFNIGAYKTSTMSAVQRGLWYASQSGSYNRPWNSRYKSIVGGAMWYGSNYVENNKYTLYLKKFNVMNGLSSVGTGQYMTNIQGAESEAAALRKGYADVLDEPMTFIIPVYSNMPSTACAKPTASGNNNSFLSSLSVDGYELSPKFDRYTTDYELVVGSDTKSITVNAKKSSSSATMTGGGTITLTSNPQTVKITVKSAGGHTRTYTITVSGASIDDSANGEDDEITNDDIINNDTAVEEDNTTQYVEPTLTSKTYKFSTYLTGVTEKTSYSSFIKKLTVKNGSVKVYDKNGKKVTSGNIATGMKLNLYDSEGVKKKSYRIRVMGDINGDGKITSVDPLSLQKHIVGSKTLSGVYLSAADINGDGRENSLDVLYIQKHIVGIYEIS